jgi:signal transduction histidine kinase
VNFRPVRDLAERALRVPIFVKIMGIAVGLTVTFAVATSWQIHRTLGRIVERDIELRARLAAADIASHGAHHWAIGDWAGLERVLQDTRVRTPDLVYAFVADIDGGVVLGSDPPFGDAIVANAPGPNGEPRVVRLEAERGPIVDVALPIAVGRGGTVRVGLSEEAPRRAIEGLMGRILRVSALVAAIGIVGAWFLTRRITLPIAELLHQAHAVRAGAVDRRVRVTSSDEIGALAEAFNEMTVALAQKERVRRDLLRRAIGSAEEERKRVARDLHDDAGQRLVSLLAGLAAAEAEAGDARSRSRLSELCEITSGTLDAIHDLSVGLRPSSLDDVGLAAAVRRHAEGFSKRFGVAVSCEGLESELSPRLPPEIEVAVYRIVQEALTNAVRHGRASAVRIGMRRLDKGIALSVEDDGAGFDSFSWRTELDPENRLGLMGIEERAELLGGVLRVDSHPGSGTRVRVEIPLPPECGHGEDPDPDR